MDRHTFAFVRTKLILFFTSIHFQNGNVLTLIKSAPQFIKNHALKRYCFEMDLLFKLTNINIWHELQLNFVQLAFYLYQKVGITMHKKVVYSTRLCKLFLNFNTQNKNILMPCNNKDV